MRAWQNGYALVFQTSYEVSITSARSKSKNRKEHPMSIKRQIENGTTTVSTAKLVTLIIILVGLGGLLLGLSLGGFLF